MKRTQVQFEAESLEQLKKIAYERGTSISSLVREAVATYFAGPPKKKLNLKDFPFIGCAKGKPSQFDPISVNHDAALDNGMEEEVQRWHKRARGLRR